MSLAFIQVLRIDLPWFVYMFRLILDFFFFFAAFPIDISIFLGCGKFGSLELSIRLSLCFFFWEVIIKLVA